MEELKPVRCGCGGEAKIVKRFSPDYGLDVLYVKCEECGTETDDYFSEAEAITAWNRAMRGNAEEKLKAFLDGMSDEMKEERHAKATPYDKDSKGYWATDGRCEGCGCYLERKYNYCPLCGARLEWNE